MIVRSIDSLKTFDFFNDYKDTLGWLETQEDCEFLIFKLKLLNAVRHLTMVAEWDVICSLDYNSGYV